MKSTTTTTPTNKAYLQKLGIGAILGCVICLVLLVVVLILASGAFPLDETSNFILTTGLSVVALVIACMILKRNQKVRKEMMPVQACPKCGMEFSPLLGAYAFCPKCGAPTGNPGGQNGNLAVNDMDPMPSTAENRKKAQNRQALIGVICCVVSIGLFILFYVLIS
ncbi:MAG TPA: hypothetical protein VKM55_04290 [Candidatus Lokiarchaeia archaeon]|nr:hypothetical protein [Candidatus Lokiarchaeia archaeon]